MAELTNLIIDGSEYLKVANGFTTERVSTPNISMMRYNEDFDTFEIYSEDFYNGQRWISSDVYSSEPIIIDNSLIYYFDFSSDYCIDDQGGTDRFVNLGTAIVAVAFLRNGMTNVDSYSADAGGCFVFDGVDDLTDINHEAAQNPTSLTISAWVNPSGLTNIAGNAHNIVGKTGNSGYRFRINGTAPQGGVGSVSFLDRGTTNAIFTTSGIISAGNWYFITITGSPSGLKIYINDTLEASNTTAFGGYTSTGNLTIGAASDANLYTESFYGKIAQVLFYNRELSSTEIELNYNSTKGRFGL